jgi:hypothetical protein
MKSTGRNKSAQLNTSRDLTTLPTGQLPDLLASLEDGDSEIQHADNETFLPIHGFVWFTDEEVQIINHPALQRLANIHQLGQAHLVLKQACLKAVPAES